MSKKKWPIIREIQYKSGASAYMVDGRIGGKGKRHFFETKGEAETKAQQLRVARENEGATAIKNFDERLRVEALQCAEKLKAFGKTLRDAVEFYLPHLQATNRTCTIEELLERLLAAKKAGRHEQPLHRRSPQPHRPICAIFQREARFRIYL
jgi:hypothetical protein